ncbi:hypothetical protein PFISCL1PPCAC_19941 [Pristionchus fissidentatus]|uniref:Uncharacterized protein n=1 Tax=Pristionchus fissidentatus TaxID=1538716 RepID=A0AAV5WFP1_9BILA|nr:hypothetical protein PFISCL1PPCAC_19941 [Pristionchus fissidentatus]
MVEDRVESSLDEWEEISLSRRLSSRRSPSFHPSLASVFILLFSLFDSSLTSDVSLPFNLEQSLTRSRFASLSGGLAKTRDIHVFVIKNISEATPIGTVLDTFKAHDKDLPSLNYTFRINRQTDPKRQFTIDQDGVLKTANLLDREDIPKYALLIEAFDNAGNVGSQMVAVYLMDENDNGPIPYTVPDPCIFMENIPVEAQNPCEIRAIDRDTAEFGPPFKMELDSSKWKYAQYLNVSFDQNGDGGNGSMTVLPLVVLDREAPFPGKVLEVPLLLWDKAGKMNRHSVYIIVGDENDNPMHDGHTSITVNSYMGKLGKTSIGRVYVEDLDDWDLGDKMFTWKNEAPGFEVSTNGELTMGAEMGAGRYEMSVNVHDNRRNEDAVGSVTVIVHEVVKEAFVKQGSLQFLLSPDTSLVIPSDFFRVNTSGVSLVDVFKQELISYLGGNVIVDVFSVQPSTATLQTTDVPVLNVRFSAHGSPFKSSEMLNGLISANRDSLESAMGTIVVGVGIDMCKFTRCDNGCETVHEADETSSIIVSANSTVFVGVNATSRDSCECPIWRAPSQCEAGLCHNDAICHNMQPGFYCECRNELVRGNRCGGTTRSFGGDSFAWYKPLPACTALTFSFDFMTQSPDGVLLYNGAFDGSSSPFQIAYGDYIAIQLRSGRIVVDMVMNGDSKNTVQVAGSRLDDGKWHTVAVRQQGRVIELVVDECRYLSPLGGKEEEATCRGQIRTQDDDERLNVVAPLQLGGLYPLSGHRKYPDSIFAPGYKGCIRNVLINDDLLDLATPAYHERSSSGCALWGSACDSNSVDSLSFCTHGDCFADAGGSAKCICDPGWSGDRCDSPIEWIQFAAGSSIQYALNIALEQNTNDVEILFVPGRSSGSPELSWASNGKESFLSAFLDGQRASTNVEIWSQSQSMPVSDISLNVSTLSLRDNTTYILKIERNPTKAKLSIDGMYHSSKSLDPAISPYVFDVKQLFLGSSPGNNRGFSGCVGSFKWDKKMLPLVESPLDSPPSSLISISSSSGVSNGCNLRVVCSQLPSNYCPSVLVCFDSWKGPICTCPDSTNVLMNENGEAIGCGERLAVSSLGISSPAIILILISLIALILLIAIVVFTSRRHSIVFDTVRPDEMERDNARQYSVEGGGQSDNDQYSIDNLRKPVMPMEGMAPPIYPSDRHFDDGLGRQIKDLENDQNAAPFDELRIYDDERDNVSMITLESIDSVVDHRH